MYKVTNSDYLEKILNLFGVKKILDSLFTRNNSIDYTPKKPRTNLKKSKMSYQATVCLYINAFKTLPRVVPSPIFNLCVVYFVSRLYFS